MISPQQTDPWLELDGFCAPEVLRAPKTWGDPLRSLSMERPQYLEGIVRYIRNNLTGQPWRDHLTLLAAVLYSQRRQYKTVLIHLSQLNSIFSDLFSVLNIQSMHQWDVDKHLVQYFTAQVLDTHSKSRRLSFWRSYQAGSRHLKRWLTTLPEEQQTIYHPFVLPYPSDPQELARLSGRRHVLHEQQEKRKEETDALMPVYADLRTQVHLRYNLLVRLRKTYFKAIKVVEQKKTQLPFEFELREGGNEQKKQPATERLIFRLWDRRTFTLTYCQRFHPKTVKAAEQRRGCYSPTSNSYLLELVRVESLDEKRPVVGLWFMELLDQNVLGGMTDTTPQEKRAKTEAWLKAQGYEENGVALIDSFKSHTPGVLLPAKSSGDAEFMRNARERTGTRFIPVEPFYVAATFAMVSLHILTANGMRIGELQQIRASAECIVPIVLPPAPGAEDQTPTVHWAIRAVPKGHQTAKTYYLDDEHLR